MPPRSAPLPGPAPVAKNGMFGACGRGGGAAGACWACAADAASNADANAETATNFTPHIGSPPWVLRFEFRKRSDFATQPEARNVGNIRRTAVLRAPATSTTTGARIRTNGREASRGQGHEAYSSRGSDGVRGTGIRIAHRLGAVLSDAAGPRRRAVRAGRPDRHLRAADRAEALRAARQAILYRERRRRERRH